MVKFKNEVAMAKVMVENMFTGDGDVWRESSLPAAVDELELRMLRFTHVEHYRAKGAKLFAAILSVMDTMRLVDEGGHIAMYLPSNADVMRNIKSVERRMKAGGYFRNEVTDRYGNVVDVVWFC